MTSDRTVKDTWEPQSNLSLNSTQPEATTVGEDDTEETTATILESDFTDKRSEENCTPPIAQLPLEQVQYPEVCLGTVECK